MSGTMDHSDQLLDKILLFGRLCGQGLACGRRLFSRCGVGLGDIAHLFDGAAYLSNSVCLFPAAIRYILVQSGNLI